MGEPKKAIAHLTDCPPTATGILPSCRRVPVRSIDRFFMQVRRLLSLMERPNRPPATSIGSRVAIASTGPERIQQLFDIYRVYYNYVAAERDKKAPAMRISLAKGRVRIEDILYFGSREPRKLQHRARATMMTLAAVPPT